MLINPVPPNSQFYCNESCKIAYLKLQKCGCSSIAHFVASLKTKYIVSPIWKEENLKHHFDKVTSEECELTEYFTFTFVRHPLSRFLSFYNNWVVDPPHDGVINHYGRFGLYKNMSLEECVKIFVDIEDYSLLEDHTIPMHRTVFRGSTSRAKFIGKLENFRTDFNFVQHACGIKMSVPHKNKRSNTLECNGTIKHLIWQYYEKDYELFGYQKDLPVKAENVQERGGGNNRQEESCGIDQPGTKEHFCIGDMTLTLVQGAWKELGVHWLWISNCAEFEINSRSNGQLSLVVLFPDIGYHQQLLPLLVSVLLNEQHVSKHIFYEIGECTIQFPIEKGVQKIKIFTDKYIVPHHFCGNCDNRKLSVIVKDFRLD